ncbi:hypothetical protein [Gallaecimonas sp. GXIMD4217]|uniref:hypothetical protein n=1 Tax=Gallaecimonas sp. GXIMD4217 TaxID=3131927 RepID=UPI00311B1541
MKKTLALLSLSILAFTAWASPPPNQVPPPSHGKPPAAVPKAKGAPPAAHQKFRQEHNRKWQHRRYDDDDRNQCWDAWGYNLGGRFDDEQRYFIELGGGHCREQRRDHDRDGDIDAVLRAGLDRDDVYKAINLAREEFDLNRARFVRATEVDNSIRNIRYTLVFKTRRGYRHFRVKQRAWTGQVRDIWEVR